MILDVFDRDHGSCCIDEDQPPRIEDKGASRENAQLGRIDSIEMRVLMGLNLHFDFALPPLFRLRTFARRFISALRCSAVMPAQ
jgi:hypothetical protein